MGKIVAKIHKNETKRLKIVSIRLWYQRFKERQADLIKLNKALEFNRC